jgi:hypothetical protein
MQALKGIKDPILITGCARSGTSITAGIIHKCGAWGGNLTGPTPHNKKGQFENVVIRQQLVKPFLRSMKCDPLGQRPLPDIENVKLISSQAVIDFRWKIRNTIISEGYKENSTWYYKGAKMCLIWPLWKRMFPNAKWIIVRRNTNAIVHSCMKTSFMRGYRSKKGWMHWVDEHKERFLEMAEAGMDITQIWPSKMIEERDFTEAKRMIANLGLEWNEEAIMNFIEPALWTVC